MLYVQPFAEEMNRSRRAAATQSRALADAGFDVLQVDLGGCGDSAGEFGDATWSGWMDDVEAGAAWLAAHCGGPQWIWGMRAGALLAAGALARGLAASGLLMVQPVLTGEQVLRQFLRMNVGAGLVAGRGREGGDSLTRQLEGGMPVEVAGYHLGPLMASELARAQLTLPASIAQIECIEIAPGPDATLSPRLAERVEQWRAAGHLVHAAVVDAPPVWQTVEVAECPALTAATVAALTRT